jgi:hypothetical protein
MFDNAQNPHGLAYTLRESIRAVPVATTMAPQRFPRVEMQKPGHFQGALIDGTILLLGTNLAK